MSALTTELPGIANGIERHAVELERGPQMAMAARYMSRERWDTCLEIMTHLSVEVPMPPMSLQALMEIKVGAVLEAEWPATHDIPLTVEDIFLACVEMEPVGDKLGVRINGFNEQPRPMATPKLDLKPSTTTGEGSEANGGNCALEDIQLTPRLCFGRTTLPMRDVLGFCVGDMVVLDRLVVSPVTVEAGGRTVASGELVLLDGGYAVRVTGVSEMRRHLPQENAAF